MAILLNGINGPFSGKVGTVVGYVWKGKAVMRGLPQTTPRKPSILQRQQHAKFALMHSFLQGLLGMLNETFKTVAVQMTGYNKAFSYNVKNAISGAYPELAINYKMVLLGRGDLPNVETAVIDSPEKGKLNFTWTDNSGTGKAKATDKVFLAAYSDESKTWIYILNASPRNAGSHVLEVPTFSGKMVNTYMGFITANSKDVSDTIYTGETKIL